MTNDFGYNIRSGVIGALMGTKTYSYAFDPIGNCLTATNNGSGWTYLSNPLNPYTNIMEGAAPLAPLYDLDGNPQWVEMSLRVFQNWFTRNVTIALCIAAAGVSGQNVKPTPVVPKQSAPATKMTVVTSGTNALWQTVASICTNPAFGKGAWQFKQVAIQETNMAVVSVAATVAGRTYPGAVWTLTGAELTLQDVLRQNAAIYQCYLFETDIGAGFFNSSHYLKPGCLVLSGEIRYADSGQTVSKLELVRRTGIGEAQVLLSNNGRYLCVVEIETTTLRFYSGVRFYDYGEEPFTGRCPNLTWLIDGQYTIITSCTNLTLNTINHVNLTVPRSR